MSSFHLRQPKIHDAAACYQRAFAEPYDSAKHYPSITYVKALTRRVYLENLRPIRGQRNTVYRLERQILWYCKEIEGGEYQAHGYLAEAARVERFAKGVTDLSVWLRHKAQARLAIAQRQRRELAGLYARAEAMANVAHDPDDGVRDALQVFGLMLPFDVASLKARFRMLAKCHHPDVDGDAAQFRALYAHYDLLQRFLKDALVKS